MEKNRDKKCEAKISRKLTEKERKKAFFEMKKQVESSKGNLGAAGV